MSTKITSIEEISKEDFPDGSVIAIGGVHSHNVPMALVRRLIRIGINVFCPSRIRPLPITFPGI